MKRLAFLLAAAFVCLYASAQQAPDYSCYILTPKAPSTPQINGPKVYGARPGADFLFRIPASGQKPMRFTAKGLPCGLKLDAGKGIITGKERWEVKLHAHGCALYRLSPGVTDRKMEGKWWEIR